MYRLGMLENGFYWVKEEGSAPEVARFQAFPEFADVTQGDDGGRWFFVGVELWQRAPTSLRVLSGKLVQP